jgi:hypothetical protein
MSEVKKKDWERFAGFWERVHYGLGGAALIGSVFLPAEAAAPVGFGLLVIGYGYLWNRVKNPIKNRLAAA